MGKHWAVAVLVLGSLAVPGLSPSHAQELEGASSMVRDAFATLLGLELEEGVTGDGSSDIYRSILDNPDAPRLLTYLEVGGNVCRARTASALQFPGKWAVLSLTLTDLRQVTRAVAYGSLDDMIAERKPLQPNDPDARQLVLEGIGLRCTRRLSLGSDTGKPVSTCSDRLDIAMTSEAQTTHARKALALMAEKCGITVLAN
ncbi:hypothetical protein IB238_03375 [Rhizobium sp. ARZ01]|uniref:hypothetical protein n=1 Tax=Rhizobium sp. ARZ01 TaxID=2769313 RepID=UPI00178565FF|nr:hypothetical protein [Rhizobium sp. ARZ01]MBD9371682.1 hypothetical protein [Rhizobium sp. ARZ01]